MKDKRTISIAIPTYNRFEMTVEATAQVIDDKRVSEICITDDASTDGSYEKLVEYYADNPKVELYRNKINQDCYRSKFISIRHADNDWVIILDSDNIIDKSYLDKIFAIKEWQTDTVYQPSWAKPHFDFRAYEGITFSKENIAEYIDKPMMSTLLNAFNYFVHRRTYMAVWNGTTDPVTADSIFHNYNWLKLKNKIYVVPDLHYEHRVHPLSHYKLHVARTPVNFYKDIEDKLRQLK